jgi:SagB-type dehydrogenase family enzyme
MTAPLQIKLPSLSNADDLTSLSFVLKNRKTQREYADSAISLENLSQLLYAGQGQKQHTSKLMAPSAQEQYPLSVFLVANRVSDIVSGLYQYDNSSHSLTTLNKGTYNRELAQAAIGDQPWVSNAAAIIVLTGNITSMNLHFANQPPLQKRGERYTYIEAGAVTQNIQLQATGLNIGMVLVAGFDNKSVIEQLALEKHLEPLALLCIGNVKS